MRKQSRGLKAHGARTRRKRAPLPSNCRGKHLPDVAIGRNEAVSHIDNLFGDAPKVAIAYCSCF
jgi:hypothetical protein